MWISLVLWIDGLIDNAMGALPPRRLFSVDDLFLAYRTNHCCVCSSCLRQQITGTSFSYTAMGAPGASEDNLASPFLKGLWEPVTEEHTALPVKVISGAIPAVRCARLQGRWFWVQGEGFRVQDLRLQGSEVATSPPE